MMSEQFKQWLTAQGFETDGLSKFSCHVHGRRNSGTWNFNSHVYECFHCLVEMYKAETGATTIEQQLPFLSEQANQIVKIWRAGNGDDDMLKFYIQRAIQDNQAKSFREGQESLNLGIELNEKFCKILAGRVEEKQ